MQHFAVELKIGYNAVQYFECLVQRHIPIYFTAKLFCRHSPIIHHFNFIPSFQLAHTLGKILSVEIECAVFPRQPFKVFFNNQQVEVLGTTFNINIIASKTKPGSATNTPRQKFWDNCEQTIFWLGKFIQ